MSRGHLCIVLHAHLPFVRHPEFEDCLEEAWLYEAILEVYIPLLWALEELAEEGVDYRLTLSLSPTLVSMLNDELLRARFVQRLERLCELSEREVLRTRQQPQFHDTAKQYRERFARARRDYEQRWKRNLVLAFSRLAAEGRVELITCAATHGYLPLLAQNPDAVRVQVDVGLGHHRRAIGAPANGIWLPECGFYPGLDSVLSDAGVRYSFVETHAIDHASAAPDLGVYAPLRCPSGLTVFGRDPETTRQVWSSEQGYPGDPDYREYYRDAGFDLDPEQLGSCLHPLGVRRNLGIKYHRVTGRTEAKEPYVWAQGLTRAREHAAHFCEARRQQIESLSERTARKPIIVAPYDAELFGHWWFEGPEWLRAVLRELAADPTVGLITPSEYLAQYPDPQAATPSASSWGYKGYSEMWLNGKNDWIYPHLHAAADRMVEVAREPRQRSELEARALNQAARELLLAQSSDWAFIMSQGTTVAYAVRRTEEHVRAFHALLDMVQQGRVDARALAELEARHNVFPTLDYRAYGPARAD